MSIWKEMHERSNGVSERTEDIVVREEEEREERKKLERELNERWRRVSRFEVI